MTTPEGWQLVPKVATVAMREVIEHKCFVPFSRTKGVVEAALAAAPQPPEEFCEWKDTYGLSGVKKRGCDNNFSSVSEKFCPNCGKKIKEVK